MAMITCNECGKEISDKAAICPNCGNPIGSMTVTQAIKEDENKPVKWYAKTWFIAISLFCCWPLGIALMWIFKNPKKTSARVIITIVWLVIVMMGLGSGDSSDDNVETPTTENQQVENEADTEMTEEVTTEVTTEMTTEAATELVTEATTESLESEEEFKAGCEFINYKDLLRNPDDYIGKKIVVDLKIAQVGIPGGLFSDEEYMRAYSNDEYGYWMGDEYCLTDKRVTDDTKILVDDCITVYGVYQGTMEFSNALTGTASEYPVIDIHYMVLFAE